MRAFWQSFFRAFLRVFPACATQAQAVSFNMFLAFFPMLLVALGVLTSSVGLRSAAEEMAARMRDVLPPGSRQVVTDFLARHAAHSWRWAFLGLGGTLLAGSQGMKLLMDGFRMIEGEGKRPGFWGHHARALLLLSATIVPWLFTVTLTVFGKQVRGWLIHRSGLPMLVRGLWAVAVPCVALTVAVLVLAMVYRVGCPRRSGWREVLPGAAVATMLWWVVNSAFGYYVRHVHGPVYGGLAAAIGLLLWMQLIAMVVFVGAAFNAERSGPAGRGPRQN